MLAAIIPMSNQERRLLVSCRIPASTYAIIARLAAEEGRSITNWVRQRIIEAAVLPDNTHTANIGAELVAQKITGPDDTHNCPANAVGGANG